MAIIQARRATLSFAIFITLLADLNQLGKDSDFSAPRFFQAAGAIRPTPSCGHVDVE